MAERITDQQVADLLVILRKDVSVDIKSQAVTTVKSGIKQHTVPDSCVQPLFEALRIASMSQHAILANAGFTALNHLLTRLSRQEPKYIIKEAKATLPLVVDKLGDQRDKLRALAIQAMTTMYLVTPTEAERFVRNVAMAGKSSRAKESGMQWLLQMHKDHDMPFRAFVPTLMELLEDADGMVRETAKGTVIELFRHSRDASNPAKSDLKKQLKNFKVRPAIEAAIVKELAPTSASRIEPETRPDSAPLVRPKMTASVSSLGPERSNTPAPPEAKADSVEPSYVNTNRELDEIFREMHIWFDGRETEQNWLKREESITKLRRLIAGNVPSDFAAPFLQECKALQDGIIKGVTSLRTSLSKESCALVQDIANTFGPGMDPMVELFMQTFVKATANTKKIASQLANTTVSTIVGRVTYNARIMQHMWMACQDKNVQPRTYVSGWLTTLIKKEGHHKSHIEHSGGLDLLEKCIKKGLTDANPGVRAEMRATYWTFAPIWPSQAEKIMNGLDGSAQKLLQKDVNNPNSTAKAEPAPRPGLGFSKSTIGTTSKPSLRETMMAQKRALTTKTLPPRPGSAMAAVSPARTTSTTTTVSTASGAAPSTTRPRSDTAGKSHAGISAAPMRPAKRRPEMAPRPATAGPYSGRNHDTRASPPDVKSKPLASKTILGSPKRTAPKSKPGHQPTRSETGITSPPRPLHSKTAPILVSPRTSPAKVKATVSNLLPSSPSKATEANEDLTLEVPSIDTVTESANVPQSPPEAPTIITPEIVVPEEDDHAAEPASVDDAIATEGAPTPAQTPSKSLTVYEDPFTEDQATPKPTVSASPERPVLEDKPVNADAAQLSGLPNGNDATPITLSADKSGPNARLLDSGIKRVKAQTLDVHGFRKLQSILRDPKSIPSDSSFDALLLGLFEYLEAPLDSLENTKIQDVKAQILATTKLLLKNARDNFQPHVSRGLEALITTRANYDARTHIVSGLELLAEELAKLGDAPTIAVSMTRRCESLLEKADARSGRSLQMGLHIMKQLVENHADYDPSESELQGMCTLSARCLDSKESGVRMDAVHLCVQLHARVGEQRFWDSIKGLKDDPKNLITYYIVKHQRETGMTA
ncbi:hypothetical protein PFICI_04266 [Pestalotiopsis fici W106-1]|uniref:TOG domain-containing protein n=1 Tax=Pestalotiopsis fici (strain W106-1 / CGMCC3.15140) TaxID=1229662 RepID=W3X8L9_PESFW|nr:uncharacterized protein PFICI_04266 [Pestalotiopsis fici W106-1]ETS82390.1 hypothetical protein PFICI_04266 [Pestalotiopsis fici W106-1]